MMAAVMPNGWPRGRVLPRGWSAPLLSDMAHRESGHTPERGVPEYWNGGIKWLSLVDCDRLNRIYVGETAHTISKKGIENSSAKLLPEGVVVLSRDAGVGQSAITTTPMAVSQHFLAWQCSEKLEPVFLYYWFQFIRPELERIAVGSTIKTIGLPYFNRMRVPLPPVALQRKSVDGFFWLDQTTYRIDEIVEAKRKYMLGLAQQLLTGKKRFPEFESRAWVEVTLGRFFKEKSKLNSDRKETLVYSCTKTVGIVPQTERFAKRLASADLARYKVVDAGDLVYDPMLLWDGSIGFVPEGRRGVVSPAYETFSVLDEANQNYFRVLLKSYNLLHQYKKISKGTNTRRRKAGPSDFLRIVVPMPPTREEQNRIAQVLQAAQNEIDILEGQRKLFQQYKRGLMDRLLSGEFR